MTQGGNSTMTMTAIIRVTAHSVTMIHPGSTRTTTIRTDAMIATIMAVAMTNIEANTTREIMIEENRIGVIGGIGINKGENMPIYSLANQDLELLSY